MFLLKLAVVLSGISLVFRICMHQFGKQSHVWQLTFLVTGVCALIMGATFVFAQQRMASVLLAVIGALVLALPVLSQWLWQVFLPPFPPWHHILDEVHANMIVGSSFRTAWKEMCRFQTPAVRTKLERLLTNVVFSQQDSQNLQKDFLLTNLVRIDREHHRAKERLMQLRQNYFQEFKFRRKSRQVSMQVRMQAAVLSFLFMALVVIQLVNRTWEKQWLQMLAIAGVLFVAGLFGFFRVLRGFRWNI